MRIQVGSVAVFVLIFVITACKKDKNSSVECFTDAPTIRQIANKQATIRSAGGKFYIIEQGSIDSKLDPCNLTQEFQVDNIEVIISGDVKSRLPGGAEPCCIDNFVIAKITR